MVRAERLASAVDARHARAAQGGHRPELLAVPSLPPGRRGHRHRLAAIGEVAASLRARARMGGGAIRLAVARRFALDAICLRAATARSTAPACWRWRWACSWCAAANASRFTANARRRPIRALAYRRIGYALAEREPADDAVPPDAPLPRNAQFVWFGDFLAPMEEIEPAIRRLTRGNAGGRLVHIIDPAEEDFPYAGRTRFEAVKGTREPHAGPRGKRGGGISRALQGACRSGGAVGAQARLELPGAPHRPVAADRAGGALCRSRRAGTRLRN